MPRKKKRFGRRRTTTTRSRFAKPVDMPDVGGFVKEQLYDLKISIPAMAKRMSVSADRGYRLIRRKDWKVSEIMNVSTIIQLNIFDWYAEQTQGPEPVAEQPALTGINTDAELQLLKQKNAVLEAENKLLREMVEVLKAK